jgi:hypothetical protein
MMLRNGFEWLSSGKDSCWIKVNIHKHTFKYISVNCISFYTIIFVSINPRIEISIVTRNNDAN